MADLFWDTNAQAWSTLIDSQGIPSRQSTTPAVLDVIRSLKPQSILDVGCGEGFLAPLFLQQGWAYLGLDGSEKLVELAKKKQQANFEAVSYEQIIAKKWQAPRSFDVVLFNFALFDDKVAPLLAQFRSCLTAQGRLVIQTLHPLSMKEYKSGWNIEDFKGMSVPMSGAMPWYGRTLSDWLAEFKEAGFIVEALKEPLHDGKVASVIFVLAPKS